jgi:hypothetical protein
MRVRMKCLSLRKSASCPNSRKDEKPDCPLRRSLSLHSQDFTWANVKVSGLKQHVKWRFHLHIPVAQLRFCHTIIPFKIPSWNLGASVIRPGGGMLFATRMAAPRSAASSDSFATRSQRAIASPGPPQGLMLRPANSSWLFCAQATDELGQGRRNSRPQSAGTAPCDGQSLPSCGWRPGALHAG